MVPSELSKNIGEELNVSNLSKKAQYMNTRIPIVDIIINIDLFTSHFEDRNKVLRIIKELYNHCTSMKKLMSKHSELILKVLLRKYDK